MAREDQGLKYGLIVTVVLMIVLGVSTFLCYSRMKDLTLKLQTAEKSARDNATAASDAKSEVKDLRRMLGVNDTDALSALSEQYDKDMKTWAGNFPEKSRFYRPALEYIFTALKTANTSLADAKKEIDQWKEKYEQREANTAPVIKRFEEMAKKADQDLAEGRDKFKSDVGQITAKQAEILAENQKIKSETETTVASVIKEKDSALATATAAGAAIVELKHKINDVTKDIPDRYDGEVRWVNQGAKTVWINLGRSDGLIPQTTFAVYPGSAVELSKAVKKASIDVLQVLGDHIAEARILDDNAIDPVTVGDKIFTPVWKPGERRHFALAGLMDVSGDGLDDTKLIRNLITMNGGIIDAELDPKTNKRIGAVTTGTRYIVVGAPPSPVGEPKKVKDAMDAYSNLQNDAKRLGVEEIKVGELLNRMGWKSQARVTRLGPGGNLPAPLAENGPQRRTTAELFRPRDIPAHAAPKTVY